MARTSDTADKTMTTAWQLLADGIYPSAQSIRERIQQGSMTTINDTLKKDFWPAVSQRLQSPPIPEPISDIAEQLWCRALEVADHHYDEAKRHADERVVVAESRCEEYQAQLRQRDQQLEQQSTAFEATNHDLTSARQALEKAREDIQTLNATCAQRETALTAANDTHAQLKEQSTAALAFAKSHAEALEQQWTQRYEDQQRMCERVETQLVETTAESQQRLATQEADIDEHRQTEATLRQQLLQAQALLADQREQNTLSAAELQQLNNEFEAFQKQHQALLTDQAQSKKKQETLTAQLAQAKLEKAQAQQEAKTLAEQLRLFREKIGD